MVSVLGEGAFGKCFLVQTTSSLQPRVIKQIDLNPLSHTERNEALREAKILEKLKHPNVIRFHEVYKTRKNKLCIVMEHADDGDLARKIDSLKETMPENVVLDYFVQICLGLKHVHDRKIVHRDLKSQNIFLKKTGEVKLGDFGIAKVMTHTRDHARSIVGTPYYLSPEIVLNQPYSFKSDIWALGVLLYEMCTLRLPFQATSIHGLAVAITRGKYAPLPARYSKAVRDLLASLLTLDPSQRPSIDTVLTASILEPRIRTFLNPDLYEKEFLRIQSFPSESLLTTVGLETSSSFQITDQSLTRASPRHEAIYVESPAQQLEELEVQKGEIALRSDYVVHMPAASEEDKEEQQRALRRLELKVQVIDLQEALLIESQEPGTSLPLSGLMSTESSPPCQSSDQFFPNAERAEAMRVYLEEAMGASLFSAYSAIKEVEETVGTAEIEVYYERLRGVVREEEMEQRLLQILVLLELEK